MTSHTNSNDFSKIEKVVQDAQIKTQSNRGEWEPRFQKYAENIQKNRELIIRARRRFYECEPLKFYLTITDAQKASKSLLLSVRYEGQIVSELSIKNENLSMRTNSKIEVNNKLDFGFDIVLKDADWGGKESIEFRKYFKNNPERTKVSRKGNSEHRVESMLLTEFSKRKSQGKALSGIRPVSISGLRFSMPTPLSASNHKTVKYTQNNRASIDILARVGSGPSAKLCIIEVKDKNEPKEPPCVTVMQAAVYAAFIRELLRSDAGDAWWKLFGFSKEIPKKLTLLAACAMPPNENDDTSFDKMEIDLGEDDKIRLHYIYFKENGKEIINIKTSLNQ